ncbi:hypothetical protein F8M41_021758 [Gigaspora margarita]|uniref:Uncharacterized protein n=1 Tax=Gigaspora margarita TaxID=4874 RepID=A0A8H4AG73_GIGMA|nr:hypothetical protein F8M41_021758 [Gigaspora margarita]
MINQYDNYSSSMQIRTFDNLLCDSIYNVTKKSLNLYKLRLGLKLLVKLNYNDALIFTIHQSPTSISETGDTGKTSEIGNTGKTDETGNPNKTSEIRNTGDTSETGETDNTTICVRK